MRDVLDLFLCAAAICSSNKRETHQRGPVLRFNLRFNLFSNISKIYRLWKWDHSLSAYREHSVRCGSGLGVALCLPSWRHTPSERVPPIRAAAKTTQINSEEDEVRSISVDTNTWTRVFSIEKKQQHTHTVPNHYKKRTKWFALRQIIITIITERFARGVGIKHNGCKRLQLNLFHPPTESVLWHTLSYRV